MSTISVPLGDNDMENLDALYVELEAAEKERCEGRMLDGPSVMTELSR